MLTQQHTQSLPQLGLFVGDGRGGAASDLVDQPGDAVATAAQLQCQAGAFFVAGSHEVAGGLVDGGVDGRHQGVVDDDGVLVIAGAHKDAGHAQQLAAGHRRRHLWMGRSDVLQGGDDGGDAGHIDDGGGGAAFGLQVDGDVDPATLQRSLDPTDQGGLFMEQRARQAQLDLEALEVHRADLDDDGHAGASSAGPSAQHRLGQFSAGPAKAGH